MSNSLINPGIVATSPFVAGQCFFYTSRTELIGDNGRRLPPELDTQKRYGTVKTAGKNDLERLPEGQRSGNIISVTARGVMQGPEPGVMPGIITWRGTDYVVIKSEPFPQFGEGWYHALASSQNSIDLQVEGDAGGGYVE